MRGARRGSGVATQSGPAGKAGPMRVTTDGRGTVAHSGPAERQGDVGNVEPLLEAAEVAHWLGVSPETLRGWRLRRTGPPFVRLTRKVVRYRRSDVETWIATSVKPEVAM